jgi:uncharacterized protein (TIGR03435 family)
MRIVWLAFLLALPLCGQESTFEVASVKPSQSRDSGSGIRNGRGGMQTKNTSLQELIRYALAAQDFQITGGPSWIKDARFDVNATNDRAEEALVSPGDVKNNEARIARIRARLLHLLEARFQLQLREEQREVPVYALGVEKGGARLKAAPEPVGNVNLNRGNGAGSLSAKGVTMGRLCDVLSTIVERPVTDETALEGAFDVELKYSLDLAGPNAAGQDAGATGKEVAQAFPSLFTAVKEQLGLRLTSKKGLATTWVVVRAEKPEEN